METITNSGSYFHYRQHSWPPKSVVGERPRRTKSWESSHTETPANLSRKSIILESWDVCSLVMLNTPHARIIPTSPLMASYTEQSIEGEMRQFPGVVMLGWKDGCPHLRALKLESRPGVLRTRLPVMHSRVLRCYLFVLSSCDIWAKATTTHSCVSLFWALTLYTCYTNLETWYLTAPRTLKVNFKNYYLVLFWILKHQKRSWTRGYSLDKGSVRSAGGPFGTKDTLSFENLSSASFFWRLLFQGLPSLISLPKRTVECITILSLLFLRLERKLCFVLVSLGIYAAHLSTSDILESYVAAAQNFLIDNIRLWITDDKYINSL